MSTTATHADTCVCHDCTGRSACPGCRLAEQGVSNFGEHPEPTYAQRAGHLPTCGPYCAKQHCACGRDAAHGSKKCTRCM